MKKAIFAVITAVVCAFVLCGCAGKHIDAPPEPSTPEPAALSGVYEGECGTLTFNGDGESVAAEFKGDAAALLPSGDMTYGFYWKNNGKCRYDVADNFKLSGSDATYEFKIAGEISEKALNFKYTAPDGSALELRLTKQSAASSEG